LHPKGQWEVTRTILAVVAVATTCAACATPTIWSKEGAVEQDFLTIKYKCQKDALALGGSAYIGFGVTQRTADQSVFDACMMADGWRGRPK
jgi:hypothetical protein